jgi:hypothetical protein
MLIVMRKKVYQGEAVTMKIFLFAIFIILLTVPVSVASENEPIATTENPFNNMEKVVLQTFNCKHGDNKFHILKKGYNDEEANEGYYDLLISYNGQETDLPQTDVILDKAPPKESLCENFPVFEIEKNYLIIFSGQDDRPFSDKLVANIFGVQERKILATEVFQSFVNILLDKSIYVFEQIPRSDTIINDYRYKGEDVTCYESDVILGYKLTYNKALGMERMLDLDKTFEKFKYKDLFKNTDDFSNFFNVVNKNNENILKNRWYYILKNDNQNNALCIFSTNQRGQYPNPNSTEEILKWRCK